MLRAVTVRVLPELPLALPECQPRAVSRRGRALLVGTCVFIALCGRRDRGTAGYRSRVRHAAREALARADLEAFDALDAALEDPEHVLAFRMGPGDMLFVDNTTTAHDRDAYEDDPAAPRLMLRLWLDHRAATEPRT